MVVFVSVGKIRYRNCYCGRPVLDGGDWVVGLGRPVCKFRLIAEHVPAGQPTFLWRGAARTVWQQPTFVLASAGLVAGQQTLQG